MSRRPEKPGVVIFLICRNQGVSVLVDFDVPAYLLVDSLCSHRPATSYSVTDRGAGWAGPVSWLLPGDIASGSSAR